MPAVFVLRSITVQPVGSVTRVSPDSPTATWASITSPATTPAGRATVTVVPDPPLAAVATERNTTPPPAGAVGDVVDDVDDVVVDEVVVDEVVEDVGVDVVVVDEEVGVDVV